jgi:SAM-dependent methyltransferase
MVREASARLAGYGCDRFSCLQGDIEHLPFENESMDVVLCLGVLPYLPDDCKAVGEMRRVLKRGGMGIAVMPNLVKLGSLLDPYYYLVRASHYAWYRLAGHRSAASEPLPPERFHENRMFGIRRYTRGEVADVLAGCGIVGGMTAIDFGPLTFWRRKLLPDGISIRLSDYLARLSRRWNWLNLFPNEWVVCFRKPAWPEERP